MVGIRLILLHCPAYPGRPAPASLQKKASLALKSIEIEINKISLWLSLSGVFGLPPSEAFFFFTQTVQIIEKDFTGWQKKTTTTELAEGRLVNRFIKN